MKKGMLVLLIVVASAVYSIAAVPDRVTSTRPVYNSGIDEWGYFWMSFKDDPGGWNTNIIDIKNDNLGLLPWFGWLADEDGADAQWADFNGDGIDDKLNISPAMDGNGVILAYQFAAAYSDPNGDYWSNLDVLDPNGDNGLIYNTWAAPNTPSGQAEMTFPLGDLDGDGISDSVGVVRQQYLVDPNAPLLWHAYLSDSNTGIARYPSPVATWNGFGLESDNALMGDINGDGYDDRVTWHLEQWPNIADGNALTYYVRLDVDYSGAGTWGDSVLDEYGLLPCGRVAEYSESDLNVGVTDIDGDGMDDIAVMRNNTTSDTVDLLGWFTVTANLTGSGFPGSMAWTGTVNIMSNAAWVSADDSAQSIEFAKLDSPQPQFDLDGDRVVDSNDLGLWVANWLDRIPIDIELLNGSFEFPIVEDGNYVNAYPGGFFPVTTPNLIEMRNPNDTDIVQPTDGSNYIYIKNNVNQFSAMNQWIGEKILPDTIYRLEFDVTAVNNFDVFDNDWYQVGLAAQDGTKDNPTWVGFIVDASHATNPPDVNNWTHIVLEFDTNDANYTPYVGKLLMFSLNGSDIAYDNVVLSVDDSRYAIPYMRFINADFEDPAVTDGSFVRTYPTEWYGWDANQTEPNLAIRNPSAMDTLQASSGQQYVYLGEGGETAGLRRFVAEDITPATTYTFQVDIGIDAFYTWVDVRFEVWDSNASGPFFVEAGPLKQYASWMTDAPLVYDGWYRETVVLDTSDYPQYIGKNLQIALTGDFICFDNASITVDCKLDENNDGFISFVDYAAIANGWLEEGVEPWYSN